MYLTYLFLISIYLDVEICLHDLLTHTILSFKLGMISDFLFYLRQFQVYKMLALNVFSRLLTFDVLSGCVCSVSNLTPLIQPSKNPLLNHVPSLQMAGVQDQLTLPLLIFCSESGTHIAGRLGYQVISLLGLPASCCWGWQADSYFFVASALGAEHQLHLALLALAEKEGEGECQLAQPSTTTFSLIYAQ